jgi:hypothetical protein
MSSTLCIQKTPTPIFPKDYWTFGYPLKGYLAKKFYDHDGSLGGGLITVSASDCSWFEGVLAAARLDEKDKRSFEEIVDLLRNGHTIDMWFEV